MSRIIPATCEAGTVTADGVEVEGAEILSSGEGASSGKLLIDGPTATYFTSNAPDISQTIDKINEALNKLVTILTSIGAGMTGPTTAPPPTLATDLSEITAIVSELTTLKGQLK